MALDKLVDSTKLDACLDAEADAIRAKTGDSNDITFDFANNKGFADAIAAIPSGGSAPDEWHFVGEFEVLQDVHTFQIDTSNYNYNSYLIFGNGSFSASDWSYVYINNFRSGYGSKITSFPANPVTITFIPPLAAKNYQGIAYAYGWGFTPASTSITAINSISVGAYTVSVKITAGTKFTVYGMNA